MLVANRSTNEDGCLMVRVRPDVTGGVHQPKQAEAAAVCYKRAPPLYAT